MSAATEPCLTVAEAKTLRAALTRAKYAQEFDGMGRAETWFSPTSASSRLFQFSQRTAGVLVSYSDATQTRTVSFGEAMRIVQAGGAK